MRYFLYFIALFLLTGCVASQGSYQGVLVRIYQPASVKEALVCSTDKHRGILYVYVGPETISGNISPEEKRVLSQFIKTVLTQTRFINPVSLASLHGEYPDFSVRIHTLKIIKKKERDRIIKKGILEASFSIRQAGVIDCVTGEPILVEKLFQAPFYKKEILPSDYKIKEEMVKEAVLRVVRQFVPTSTSILRVVKYGDEKAKKMALMLNNSNCRGAYEYGEEILQTTKKDLSAEFYYNMGVALECLAWQMANDQKTQYKYLKKSLTFYKKAAFLKPEDKEMQKAYKDVSYELNTFYSSFERQKETHKLYQQIY